MTTLQQAIEQVKNAGNKAFVPYIMAGDGGLSTVKPTILSLQKMGVTALEGHFQRLRECVTYRY
ncbi:hypothetical protein LSPH24S_07192 [Lysinibacillus sphaericus]